jgi:cysteine desulfurase
MRAYLDNLATTPLDPRALAAMLPLLSGPPGNPHARAHPFGAEAAAVVDAARARIGAALGVRSAQVVFTPTATAADNLAVTGVAAARERRGRRVLVASIEHPAVLEPARALRAHGFDVVEIPVGADGVVDPDAVRQRLAAGTTLVCLMLVNNEVGSVQPVAEVAELAHQAGALLHCDAAQAPGKVALAALAQADYVTLSSHKAYGPKGAAALVMGRTVARPRPLILGGGQGDGQWPGTLNVPAIAGFACALELAVAERDADAARIAPLARRLADGMAEAFPGTVRNGAPAQTVCHCVSLAFEGVPGETLLSALARAGVAASFGSACTTESSEPSHVLTAMGRTVAQARRTLRFGLGRFTTAGEIEYAVDVAKDVAARLRR